jgi:hypothetical protein
MGKKGKKDPNQPILVAEDAFQRAKKLQELKISVKPPKPGSDLTVDELWIPPAFHNIPELKQVVHFWGQGAIVRFHERLELKPPSRAGRQDTPENEAMLKTHTRKELQDLLKYLKSQVKGATKQTGKFLKQLAKKEKKEDKRTKLLEQINAVDASMNDELRTARKFSAKQEIFEKKYMYGSKLGAAAPRGRVLLALELSEKLAPWIAEATDEVTKFVNEVIDKGPTDTYNICLFSQGNCTTWMPQYQSKADPKKGLADSLKFLKKNFNAKVANQPYPPDWLGMINKFCTADGAQPPEKIFILCSRSPQDTNGDVLDLIKDVRAAHGAQSVPINAVAFDPTVCPSGVADAAEESFFQALGGSGGQFLVDTSQEDLVALDKMLNSVKVKKKQLDKLHKKLGKLEDLSEPMMEDQKLLAFQISIQRLLENDFNLIDYALKNETAPAAPTI